MAERILWFNLKRRQLLGYKVRRQHGIGKYVVDFYCPELKLAIEADGPSHDTDVARRSDVHRQREIEKEGVRFMRFKDEEILGNADKVMTRIEKEMKRMGVRKSHHPLPPPRGGGEC